MKELTLISHKQWDALLDMYLTVQRDQAMDYGEQIANLANNGVPFKLACEVAGFATTNSTMYLHQFICTRGYAVETDSYFAN